MLIQENRAYEWVKKNLKHNNFSLTPLAGDASFRHYYRLQYEDKHWILMEAPPERESIAPFLSVATCLKNQGLLVPDVHLADETLGFAILSDFGDTLFLNYVNKDNADFLYSRAMQELTLLQNTSTSDLPTFDAAFIQTELNIFLEWFLQKYLQLQCTEDEKHMIASTFEYLGNELEKLPTVFIHRDYHSRNLMVVTKDETLQLGVLDFQDAMLGPFTYDLTSLLKDCYIQWPRSRIMDWVKIFYENNPIAQKFSLKDFTKAFDLCGLQRHLKVLGIFSRLFLRDAKPQYLNDLPLTLHYVLAYLESDAALAPFYRFLQERVRLP